MWDTIKKLVVSSERNYIELKESNVASKSASCFPLNVKKNFKMLKKSAHTVTLHKTESKSFLLFCLHLYTYRKGKALKNFYFGEIMCFIKYHLHWILIQSFYKKRFGSWILCMTDFFHTICYLKQIRKHFCIAFCAGLWVQFRMLQKSICYLFEKK